MDTKETTHWYQEPMAIFAFAIPLATVVAGLLTVYIAVQSADTPLDNSLNRFGVPAEVDRRP